MSGMTPQQQRPIKINLGAVKRLTKEKKMNADELKEAQENIDKSDFEPGSSEMKRLVNMRDEAEASLKDVEHRLGDFRTKLEAALKEVEAQFPEDPLVVEAKALLAE